MACEWCPFKGCDGCRYQGGVERDTPSRGAPVTHGNGILDEPEKAAPEGAGNTSEGLTPGTSPRSNLGGKPVATTQDTPRLAHLSGDPDMLKYELRRRRKIEYAPTRHAAMLARTDSEGRPLYRLTEGGNVVRTRPIKEHMKRRILARDGNACIECGAKRSLEVAHIEPYRVNGNNSDENMRTLCTSCHQAEEARNG